MRNFDRQKYLYYTLDLRHELRYLAIRMVHRTSVAELFLARTLATLAGRHAVSSASVGILL